MALLIWKCYINCLENRRLIHGGIIVQVFSTPYVLGTKSKQAGRIFGEQQFDVMNIQLQTGEEIPSHKADEDVLIIVKSGKVAFTVEGQETELTSETLLHMSPSEIHSLRAVEDTDVIVVKIKQPI